MWDLGVFGIREHRKIDFTHLHQRWLREAAKGWTIERMASLRTQTAQRDVRWLGYLSDYLHAREDRGEQPERADARGHDRLPVLAAGPGAARRAGGTSIVSSTRRAVQFARRHLAGPGQPAEGIGGGFQLYHEDLPWRTERDPDEPGRALPRVVLAQLLDEDVLAPLDEQYHEYRVAFELIAHTGRRPAEICHLPADCLRYDEEPAPGGGKQRRPVLRYRREKPPSKWASLPINQDTAELIEAQQQRLRERFPDIPFSKLPLLPRRRCNPTGRLAMTSPTLSNRVTKWIKTIPPLLDEDGTEYGREHVYLYALRHSYAQRHADAGVPIDTLQKLMDHRTTATTQIYYRVTWERKREAIERVAPLTMDRRRPPDRVPCGAGRDGAAARGDRPDPGPARVLHRAAQRPGARRALPVQPPVPGLRALPHRPLAPSRPLRLPRTAAGDPRAPPRRGPAAGGVGAREGDPRRRRDQNGSHADPRRRGRARRARTRRAIQAARAVPRAARDQSADGRHRRGRADRRDPQPRADVPTAGVHAAALRRAPREPGRARDRPDRGDEGRQAHDQRREAPSGSRAVIAQIRDQGRDDDLKATVIARRAGVHRSFVSSHFAAEIAHAKAEIQSRFIAGLDGQTALSAASLRVEMETAKQQAREAQQEIRALKARLAKRSARRSPPPTPSTAPHPRRSGPRRPRSNSCSPAQVELRRQLRETEEELEAARRLNRTLMRERNTTADRATA